jgi:hypothetical protein
MDRQLATVDLRADAVPTTVPDFRSCAEHRGIAAAGDRPHELPPITAVVATFLQRENVRNYANATLVSDTATLGILRHPRHGGHVARSARIDARSGRDDRYEEQGRR